MLQTRHGIGYTVSGNMIRATHGNGESRQTTVETCERTLLKVKGPVHKNSKIQGSLPLTREYTCSCACSDPLVPIHCSDPPALRKALLQPSQPGPCAQPSSTAHKKKTEPSDAQCSRLNYVLLKRDAENRTPRTSQRPLIWTWGLCRRHQAKGRAIFLFLSTATD